MRRHLRTSAFDSYLFSDLKTVDAVYKQRSLAPQVKRREMGGKGACAIRS